MRKIFTVTILALGLCVLFAGCSASVPGEKKIKSDIAVFGSGYISDSETIESVEVIKRQTLKDAKTDTVWCKIVSKDSEAEYHKQFILTYELYEKGGWIMEDIARDNSSAWSSTPLVGVNADGIYSSLLKKTISIGEEQWEIEPDTLDNISVNSQDTKLETKKDIVVISITLKSDVQTAQGELLLTYIFDDGWKLSEYQVKKDFSSANKPNTELQVTDADLIAALTKKSIVLGDEHHEQVIGISSDEIKDFVQGSRSVSGKGTNQIIECNLILDKGVATFNIATKVVYTYTSEGGWSIQDIIFSHKLLSVNLEGEWVGTYLGNGNGGETKLVLNISKVADDGAITAIFNFSAVPTNPSVPSGSYKMVGGIDFTTLKVTLEGKEWIKKPPAFGYLNLTTAYLYIDEKMIKSNDSKQLNVKL